MKFTLALSLLTVAEAGQATWAPGNFTKGVVVNDGMDRFIRLSNGLAAKPVAIKPDKDFVAADLGYPEVCKGCGYLHPDNDGSGLFVKNNGKGYYYASNAEESPDNGGGVWVIETDNDHNVTNYYNVLNGTNNNCAGGKTPWETWVSCEERHPVGYCWQVDPEGKIPSERTNVTAYGGNWEAFAFGIEDGIPRGYTTDDDLPELGGCDNKKCKNGSQKDEGYCGALDRYTPSKKFIDLYYDDHDDDENHNKEDEDGKDGRRRRSSNLSKEDRWKLLNDPNAKHEFLKLTPTPGQEQKGGTFEWVEDPCEANPEDYPQSEGIHFEDGILTFVAKRKRQIFYLDLDKKTYVEDTTNKGSIYQQPDNIRGRGRRTFVCTDGGEPNSLFYIDSVSKCYAKVLEEACYKGTKCADGYGGSEAAGVDLTPDGKIMYVSFQDRAIWAIWREDGLAFDDETAPEVCEEGSTNKEKEEGDDEDDEDEDEYSWKDFLGSLDGLF